MKRVFKLIFAMSISAILLLSCDAMDSNYSHYLSETKQYSPRITNLQKEESLRTIKLTWDNPTSDLAVKIMIELDDEDIEPIIIDEMISEYTLTDLVIKGYMISVYTIDKYDNLSIPTSISAFPGTPYSE